MRPRASVCLLLLAILCGGPGVARAQWDDGITVRSPEEAFDPAGPNSVLVTQTDSVDAITTQPRAKELGENLFPVSDQPERASVRFKEPWASAQRLISGNSSVPVSHDGETAGSPGLTDGKARAGERRAIRFVPDPATRTPADTHSPLTEMLSPAELTPTLRTVMLVGLLSLVPAVLVMTTCFARFAIVLGLLRQGLGAQQWLPNQIVLALSLFLTLLVMTPVWTQAYHEGVRPYVEGEYESSEQQRAALHLAFADGVQPVRQFMSTQIAATGNEAAIDMLLSYQQQGAGENTSPPQYYEDVPLSVLLPAYLLSELKTAFVIGFQIVLPFLVIDLVVASVLTGMGLMMLPPVLVSLPFKLLLFVLIDGWTLTVELLLQSVPPV